MPSLCVTLEKCPRKLKKTHPSASRASVTKRRTFSTSACRASSDARISTERFRFPVQWKIHAGCKLMGLKCYKKIGRMVNPCSYILSTYQLMKWIEKPLWWFLGCCEYLKQWLLWRQTDVIAAFRSILSQHWERIALDLHGTRLDYISAAKTSHQSLNLKYLAAFLSSLRLLQMVHRAVTRLKYCIFTLKVQLKHIKKTYHDSSNKLATRKHSFLTVHHGLSGPVWLLPADFGLQRPKVWYLEHSADWHWHQPSANTPRAPCGHTPQHSASRCCLSYQLHMGWLGCPTTASRLQFGWHQWHSPKRWCPCGHENPGASFCPKSFSLQWDHPSWRLHAKSLVCLQSSAALAKALLANHPSSDSPSASILHPPKVSSSRRIFFQHVRCCKGS